MSVDYAPDPLTRRLLEMSARSDLRTELRLLAKIDYSPEAVSARLRQQSMLRRACLSCARLGREAELSGTSPVRDAS